MLKITERLATLDDFVAQKKRSPWEFYRTIAKPINFGILFGGTPSTVVNLLKNNNFEESDCDITIADLGLQKDVQRWMDRGKDHRMAKYFACAEFFRQKFVDTYPGLPERGDREFKFAQEHGYVRTWHGPVRHLPSLKLVKFDKANRPIGDDQALYGSFFNKNVNRCSNTPIQSLEAYVTTTWIHCIVNNMKDWDFKSRYVNMVHDSSDWYVYEPELDVVCNLARHCATLPRPPYVGVPLDVDIEVADISTGGYYKHGNVKFKFTSLEEALAKYNAEHGTELRFTDYIEK